MAKSRKPKPNPVKLGRICAVEKIDLGQVVAVDFNEAEIVLYVRDSGQVCIGRSALPAEIEAIPDTIHRGPVPSTTELQPVSKPVLRVKRGKSRVYKRARTKKP